MEKMIEKTYIGKIELPTSEISYYMINKLGNYGVELAEASQNKITSSYEFFSENEEEVLSFAKKLCNLGVTRVTLQDVIDDYMSH